MAGGPKPSDDDDASPEDPIRFHLATAYPAAMNALVKAKIFTVHWLHDYQGVCFPLEESSASMVRIEYQTDKLSWLLVDKVAFEIACGEKLFFLLRCQISV